MKHINVVAAIVRDGDRIFATQRGYGEYKDYWEFPGGKIEEGETPEAALKREIMEELDTEIDVGPFLCTVDYDYPAFHITLHCYFCSVISGSLTLKEHESARWLSPSDLDTVNWLPADLEVIKTVRNHLLPFVKPIDNKIVVGIGEVLWDMLPEGKKLGGAPANFAYHVSQFGIKSTVVSAVGRDIPGKEILDILGKKGLDGYVSETDYPTGTVEVVLDAAGVPCYDIKKNVAWDNIPFTDRLGDLAAHTSAVCFGTLAQRSRISRETIGKFLDSMPDDGKRLKIFDINLRQDFYDKEIVSESLKKCNILKINDEELAVVGKMFRYDEKDKERLCRKLLSDFALGILILTCGVNGSYVFTHDSVSYVETPKVDVVDTVGAGDSFTGTFAASLLKGKNIGEAHRMATAVSAYVCTQKGAMPELPDKFKIQ